MALTATMQKMIDILQRYAGVPGLEVQVLREGLDELEPFDTFAELNAAALDNGAMGFAVDTQKHYFRQGGSWTPVVVGVVSSDEIKDADADTYIRVEESADEDYVRIATAGSERARYLPGGGVEWIDTLSATGARITADAEFSNPQASANSESFGANAVIGENAVAVGRNTLALGNSVAVGFGAQVGGTAATVVGYAAVGTAEGTGLGYQISTPARGVAIGVQAKTYLTTSRGIAIGYNAQAGQESVAIGYNAWATGISSICLGKYPAAIADYSMITPDIVNMYIGGELIVAPAVHALHAPNSTGTDIGGSDLEMRPGESTGSAIGGMWSVWTAAAGGSGSSLNTAVKHIEVDHNGKTTLGVSPAAGTDPGATSLSDFFDFLTKDIVLAVGGGAVASVDAAWDIPAEAMVIGASLNIESAITGAGGATAIGLGIAADPDKYGETAALTKNAKATNSIGGMVALAGSEDLKVYATDGAGSATGTIVNGSVRARLTYATQKALPDAP